LRPLVDGAVEQLAVGGLGDERLRACPAGAGAHPNQPKALSPRLSAQQFAVELSATRGDFASELCERVEVEAERRVRYVGDGFVRLVRESTNRAGADIEQTVEGGDVPGGLASVGQERVDQLISELVGQRVRHDAGYAAERASADGVE